MKATLLLSVSAFFLSIGLVGGAVPETQPAARTALGTQDTRFTVNGKAVFLYGVSYFAVA